MQCRPFALSPSTKSRNVMRVIGQRLRMREPAGADGRAPRDESCRANAMPSRVTTRSAGNSDRGAGPAGQFERRIGPPTSEGGGAFVAAANRGPAGAGITTAADRLLRRGIALETKSYAATALYTTLVSLQNESSRMRGANPSLFRYFLKEWPFASYCLPLAFRSPPPAGFA